MGQEPRNADILCTMSDIQRRKLRFETIDDAIAEGDRLVAAHRAGKVQMLGRWPLGTMLNHLGIWAEYAYTGAPVKVPFFLPWIARPLRGRIINGGMPAGRRIPKVPGGTLGIEEAEVEKAARRFQIAFLRLKNDPPMVKHAIFGRLSHAEWMKLHLRHAELHFSYTDVKD